MEYEKYPSWLADRILNTSFDWEVASRTSMHELLENITLHDSSWYTIYLERGNAWVIVLDTVWNKTFCQNPGEWTFLVLKFPKVFCSFQKFNKDDFICPIVSDVEVMPLGGKDFADWMDFTKIAGLFSLDVLQDIEIQGHLDRTELSTVCGGYLSLVHAQPIEVLLYSEQGSQLVINLSAG